MGGWDTADRNNSYYDVLFLKCFNNFLKHEKIVQKMKINNYNVHLCILKDLHFFLFIYFGVVLLFFGVFLWGRFLLLFVVLLQSS